MDIEECAAKPLIRQYGISIPEGSIAHDLDQAYHAAKKIGPCVVKAQVPTGKRGKAGGIKLATTPEEARRCADQILGMTIGGHRVARLLIEAQVPPSAELYASIVNDAVSRSPLLIFSAEGGMEIEEIAARRPAALTRTVIDIRHGLAREQAEAACAGLEQSDSRAATADALMALYRVYRAFDAELIEINPLALNAAGTPVALDCKLAIDDAALPRQPELAALGTAAPLTPLEAAARAADLKYYEFDGSVGVLANGAGLTMATMDAIAHFGGKPANFLEIGGEAYTKAETALAIVLKHPRVKSLLVNFCGAFARADVMTAGVVAALTTLKPSVPVFFSVHGTGEDEAIRLLRDELRIEPFELMDDAVRAAVEAARERVA